MNVMAIFHQRTSTTAVDIARALRQFSNIVDPKVLAAKCVQFAIVAMRKQEESNEVLMLECSPAGDIRNSDVREERRRVNSLVRPQQSRSRFAAFAAVTHEFVFPNIIGKLSLYHVSNKDGIGFIRIRDELATDHLDRQNPYVLKDCLVAAIPFDQRHSDMTCAPRVRRYSVSRCQYREDCDTASRQKKPIHE